MMRVQKSKVMVAGEYSYNHFINLKITFIINHDIYIGLVVDTSEQLKDTAVICGDLQLSRILEVS